MNTILEIHGIDAGDLDDDQVESFIGNVRSYLAEELGLKATGVELYR